jgi:hypothetical protein
MEMQNIWDMFGCLLVFKTKLYGMCVLLINFYGYVDFEGVVFCLPLMGLVHSGKVNGSSITDVKQAKHFPNSEIGNFFPS